MLRLLLPKKPLDVADPRHASDIRAGAAPAQHPRELVGLEHQGGEQEVSAAAPLALGQRVIPLASPPGQLAVQIETSLSGQLRAHHSGEDASVEDEEEEEEEEEELVMVMRGILQHAAKTSHTPNTRLAA